MVRIALVLGLSLSACASPASDGKALFSSAALAGSASNQTTCALCHDAQPTARITPGYPLAGVVLRPTWWNGEVIDLLAAVNLCVADFMGGRGIDADTTHGRELFSYLDSIAKAPAPYEGALPLTVPPTISTATLAALPAGDATRGLAVYTDGCSPCHGDAGTGVHRLTEQTSVVPTELIANAMFPDAATKRTVVVEKIRHGKFYGIGGQMPPFAEERLDDQGVADIVAYFETLGL